MAEEGRRPAAGHPSDLPPPPRLVQYGVPPPRQSASRTGGGAGASLALTPDQRLETERRQQLAASIQLLQQKAARRQQEARLGLAPAGSGPLSAGGLSASRQGAAPGAARLIAYRPPAAAAGNGKLPASAATPGPQLQSAPLSAAGRPPVSRTRVPGLRGRVPDWSVTAVEAARAAAAQTAQAARQAAGVKSAVKNGERAGGAEARQGVKSDAGVTRKADGGSVAVGALSKRAPPPGTGAPAGKRPRTGSEIGTAAETDPVTSSAATSGAPAAISSASASPAASASTSPAASAESAADSAPAAGTGCAESSSTIAAPATSASAAASVCTASEAGAAVVSTAVPSKDAVKSGGSGSVTVDGAGAVGASASAAAADATHGIKPGEVSATADAVPAEPAAVAAEAPDVSVDAGKVAQATAPPTAAASESAATVSAEAAAAAPAPAAATASPTSTTDTSPSTAAPSVSATAASDSSTAAAVSTTATSESATTAAAAAGSDSTPTTTPSTSADATDTATEAASASPSHKGRKAWLSRLTTAGDAADITSDSSGPAGEHAANGTGKDGPPAGKREAGLSSRGEERAQRRTGSSAEEMDTAPQAEAESSPPSEAASSPPAEEARAEGEGKEGRQAREGSSSGEVDSAANDAESNGVLAPRAAAAATKAAAAVNRDPIRPKKRSAGTPPSGAPKRPSFMALKKSGESFAQTNFCCQIVNKLPRCRECRAVPTQRHNKPTNIYCRFTAFRKVRYSRAGQLNVSGFCDPFTDAGEESDRLWRANPDGPPSMEPEIAKFLLAHVGNQFCDLVCEEEAARRCHMGADHTVAWKRVVQGCREMCDVCETTLFNVHWVCSRCGFAVCVDCYRSRRDGTAKDWGEQVADRDQFRWLLCGAKPHQQEKLVLTQIVAGDALETLNRQVHEARQVAGLPLSCECEVAKRLEKEAVGREADGVVKTEAGHPAAEVKESDAAQKPASATLSFLADVALSKITSDDSDSDDSDCSDAGGGSLALRRLLVPGTETNSRPKPVKKERPDRPKRGWSMGDSLDEVLDKVSARCSAVPPASHTVSGPAALQHFVRRGTSKRGFRERLPIRIMTLGESTRLYPSVRHSWLCDGKLLRLHESDAPDSVRLFRDQWKRGQPVICSNIGGGLDRSLWSVEAFIRDFGDVRNDLINCRTGNIVPNQQMRRFWEGFESVTRRLRDDKGQPMILKLKDWPPGEDFADMMPQRFADLMSVLPMTDYTRRDGRLNLASCLPDIFVRPDLGPKMYIAYGCALHPSKASTNLHLDVSDAVNIMVHVGIPPDGDADNAEALRAIDEAGCDQLTKRRVRDEMPGALWHIYHAADADKIRDLLNKVAIERGDQLEPHHDPIHDQSWYLDGPLRRRLYEEYRVEGYPIVQCAGDAVFIPAGAPHQVRNLHSCIKVAEDFVSPENIGHCFDLTQEFRSLSDTHTNHEDKLQIKNIIYHAMKDAVSCLPGASRVEGGGTAAPAPDGAGETGAGSAPAGRVKTEPGV